VTELLDLKIRIEAAKSRQKLRLTPTKEPNTLPKSQLSLLQRIELYLLSEPSLSTILAAMMISTVWLYIVINILFLNSFLLGVSYNADTYTRALISPTIAMAAITIYKSSPLYERFSKGKVQKERSPIEFAGISWFLLGILFIILGPEILSLPDTNKFNLSAPKSHQIHPFIETSKEWKESFKSNPIMTIVTFTVWAMHVVINKKNASTPEWKLISREANDAMSEGKAPQWLMFR